MRCSQERERAILAYMPIIDPCNLVEGITADQKAQLSREIFHRCLHILLAPLKELSKSGVTLVDPYGVSATVYPELLVYVGDMPECKLVNGCFDHRLSKHPCEQCWCPRADLGDVSITSHRLRTESEQLANYNKMKAATPAERKKLSKKLSQHFVHCGWWGFAGGATIHCSFTGNDSLHNEVNAIVVLVSILHIP